MKVLEAAVTKSKSVDTENGTSEAQAVFQRQDPQEVLQWDGKRCYRYCQKHDLRKNGKRLT